MQILQAPHIFTFPKPLNPVFRPRHITWRPLTTSKSNCFRPDEVPVDETFLQKFGPKDKESEDEARRRNWIQRGWAPWEEILTPEANFARKSLNEGEEVPLKTPEAIEAFKMLSPKYRLKKMKEMGITEDEWYQKQFEITRDVPEKLETSWAAPMVVRHVPPRDWPPRGWEVDREELRFIREAHTMLAERVDLEEVEKAATTNAEDICLDRYKVFLKQYNEWVTANKDRLEEESFKFDQDYYPGRRKRGKDYKDGMYELPYYYPGQICEGEVTSIHLYEGAFVDIGGVHDGWVPIKGNDWYWIRHHIKVGMPVIVEILAKRDPYRFRFPIEMRFVFPNIDHLIFNRFEFPPTFRRAEDKSDDEFRRECGRPPVPRKDLEDKPEEEPLLSNHPFVDKLWLIHNAEQMILDDWETNPEKYKGKRLSELADDDDFDEENSVEYTKTYYKKALVPKVIMKQSVKELDLEAALAEREFHNNLRKEAEARGEKYKVHKLRRNNEMDEYDLMHWRRSFEEREALIRDISCRKALGLPLEEPGKFKPASFFGKDQYDPDSPLYRYDYWGEPKNSEKSRQERMADTHNTSIVGKGVLWYEMSYEEAIKQKLEREARGETVTEKEIEPDTKREDDDEDDDDDWDYSFLADPNFDFSDQPVVNGTESSRLSDEGMFED
ncbi:Nucleic acid-binding OB-fold-like protein isoform 1 [Tripterygium wilfordii]|uniref:Nucleic acid-binding OB-fold-like protein isoform 1 n=1 Tax=Tripterygium wilfordii TaxID=458696 RepID=A0A7J7DBJ0_TRIWF|nr:protein PLASTID TRANSCRIPTIONALLY ACTIVE 10 [Tripterygium wilfordii]KAF5743703.1 Nucleic acid-binding OB-fold-like protein isoform 1 [Tripterygium wilfordii]